MNATPTDLARSRFAKLFDYAPDPMVAVAPGRVNLIGEHTDYNDGHVLPMGIERYAVVAIAPRGDDVLRAHSVGFAETVEAPLSGLRPSNISGWFGYVAGVAWALRERGEKVQAADLAVAGNVPIGAGLSSSAALEMAVARALCYVSQLEWDPVRMASIAQLAENQYVGVRCGIMDQFAAAASKLGSALLLDCRSLEAIPVPIPDSLKIVVMDTGVRRALTASEYNDRRQSCEAAVAAVRKRYPDVRALRDVDRARLAEMEHMMDSVTYKRAMHVVVETGRPAAFAAAVDQENPTEAGRLMNESHESLRNLYEVSSEELDVVTSVAREHAGCFGARMSGAGFGGCAVALVASDQAESFISEVQTTYAAAVGLNGDFFVSRPAAGATLV
jgi:galactokinase